MSWLGDSFNNIKGQISNIAKEVLAEGADEVDDQDAQLKLAYDKIKALEASGASHAAQIARLEERNSELEERLSTADLQLSSVSQQHRREIVTREKELLSLRNQLRDVQDQYLSAGGRETPPEPDHEHEHELFAGSSDLDELLSAQQRINRLTSQVGQLTRERSQLIRQNETGRHGVPDHSRLEARVQELETELQETVHRHHEQIAALQDSHQHQLEQLRAPAQTLQADGDDLSQRLDDGHDVADRAAASSRLQRITAEHEALLDKLRHGAAREETLRAELRQLAGEKKQLSAGLEQLSAEKDGLVASMEQLKAEKDELVASLEQLTAEKDELVVSLEQLDLQNQAANDQVQRWRAEATALTTARDELLQRLQHTHAAATQHDALLQTLATNEADVLSLSAERSALRQEVQEKEEMVASLMSEKDELLHQVQQTEAETTSLAAAKDGLFKQLQQTKTETASLATSRDGLLQKLHEREVEVASLATTRDEMLQTLQERETEMNLLTTARDDLVEKLKEMKLDVFAFATARDEILQTLQERETEMSLLTTGKDDLVEELREVKSDLSSIATARDEVLQALQERETEMSLLTTVRDDLFEELKEMKRDVSSVATARDELLNKLHDADAEIVSLKAAKDDLLKTSHDMSAESFTKQELLQQLEDLDGKVNSLTLSKTEMVQALRAGEMTSLDAVKKVTAANQELQVRNDQLQRRLDEATQTNNEMMKKAVLLGNSLSKLEDDKRVVDEHLEYYVTKGSSLTQEKYAALQSEHQALLDRYADLEVSCMDMKDEAKEECHCVRSENCSQTDSKATLPQAVAVREEPDGQDVSDKETNSTALQTLQTRLEVEKKRAEDATLQASKLQIELEVEQKRVENATARCSELQTRLEMEQKRTGDVTSQCSELLTQLEAEQERASNATLRLSELQTQLHAEKRRSDDATMEKSELQKQLQAEKRLSDDATMEKSELQKQLQVEKRRSDDATMDKSELQKQLQAEKRRSDDATMEKSELQKQLEAEQKRAEESNARCTELQLQNVALGDTNRELRDQIEDLEAEGEDENVSSEKNENRRTAIRLMGILTLFNSDDIFASNSCTAALFDTVESSVKELQWRLQETGSELEQERCSGQQLQERLNDLEQDRILTGSAEKLETISEDAERVAELEAEVTCLRSSDSSAPEKQLELVLSEKELVEQRLRQMQLERDDVLHKVNVLQEKLVSADTVREREEQLVYEKEELDIRVQSQETELTELTARLAIAESKASKYEKEITKLSEVQADLQTVTFENESYISKVEIMEKERHVLHEQHNRVMAETDKLIQATTKEKSDVQVQLQAALAENERLGLSVQESDKQVENMQLQLKEVHQELSDLKIVSSENCHELEAELQALRMSSQLQETATVVQQIAVLPTSAIPTETTSSDAQDEESLGVSATDTTELGKLTPGDRCPHCGSAGRQREPAEDSQSSRHSQSEHADVAGLRESAESLRAQLAAEVERRLALGSEQDLWLTERQQLITALSQKHAESVQYHAEIQRLQAVHAQEARRLAETRDDEAAQMQLVAGELAQTRRARDEALAQAQQLRASQDQLLIKLQDRNKSLQELQQQTTQQEETERRLQTELLRLREHLMAIEDNYTQEALNAEQREQALRERLSSELHFTAESEAASQTIEALQEELSTVSQQRDDVAMQLDDVTNSLTNLQRVLEQFQRDKRRETELAISATQREAAELRHHVDTLKAQLQDASQGLAAANRLNEQLDRKEELIVALKSDVEAKVDASIRLRAELDELKGNTSGKVDKSLVKNLVVGYVCAPAGHEREVLRVIATVLDFSREERTRVRLDPAPAGPSTASFSQAFVRFLEAESTPRRTAVLPAEKMAQEASRRTEARAHRAQTPLAAAARTTPPPGHSRHSSSSSNLLLDQLPGEPAASSSSVLRAIIGDETDAAPMEPARPPTT